MNAKEARKLTEEKKNSLKRIAEQAAKRRAEQSKEWERKKPERVEAEVRKLLLFVKTKAEQGKSTYEAEVEYPETSTFLKKMGYKVELTTKRVPEIESYADYQGQAFRETGNFVDEHTLKIKW